MTGFLDDGPWRKPFLNLPITNHGPIVYTITRAMIEIDDRVKRPKIRGSINPLLNISVGIADTHGSFTSLSKKINVRGKSSLRFWSSEKGFIGVGIINALGRPDE